VPVNLRLKVLPEALDRYISGSALRHGAGIASVRRAKWGFTYDTALSILRALLNSSAVVIRGFSCHIGHLSNDPGAFKAVAGAFGETVVAVARETGFQPSLLDLGGGWAREREPEQCAATAPVHPIEMQVEAALSTLESVLRAGLNQMPALWVEPGRYIVGNGQLLLATVGAIKRDAGYVWLHLDVSTNNLPRIETGSFWHHMMPATRLNDSLHTRYEVVGGTCFRSVLGAERLLPELRRGDIVAILDTGMYAEVLPTSSTASRGRQAS
jgi:diaminopimelate decarboxylase